MTLNQIRTQLIEFFNDHAQVNSVIWMDEDDFIAQRDTTYPVVNMEWLDTSLSDRFLQHRFRVLIGDLYNPNVTGIEDEIYSDCVQIAGDFWSWLQENMDFNFQSSSNIQKFTDDTGDRISGITFTITISVPNSWDECAIPKKEIITTSTTTTTTTTTPSFFQNVIVTYNIQNYNLNNNYFYFYDSGNDIEYYNIPYGGTITGSYSLNSGLYTWFTAKCYTIGPDVGSNLYVHITTDGYIQLDDGGITYSDITLANIVSTSSTQSHYIAFNNNIPNDIIILNTFDNIGYIITGEGEPFSVYGNVNIDIITTPSFLLYADFESGNPLQGVFSTSSLPVYPGYSAQLDNTVSRRGTQSCRFELRSTDQLMASGRRSELTLSSTNPLNPLIRWYAWSEYLPSDYASDNLAEIHFQIADNTGMTAPNVALWLVNNQWFMNQKYNIGAGNVEVQTPISGTANLGGWDDWVINYEPAIDSSGLLRLYRNGSLVFSTTGPNANSQGGQLVPSRYPKFGIYKWPWNNTGTYNPNTRVTYIDEVKYGGTSSSLNDFLI